MWLLYKLKCLYGKFLRANIKQKEKEYKYHVIKSNSQGIGKKKTRRKNTKLLLSNYLQVVGL